MQRMRTFTGISLRRSNGVDGISGYFDFASVAGERWFCGPQNFPPEKFDET